MGKVYLAQQISLSRNVALKVMKDQFNDDPRFRERFLREAQSAARLSHPNIVQIYDVGEQDGTCYFTMELIEGKTLAEMVQAHSRLSVETTVDYILQTARGLQFAHQQGIIHRDVKPHNLLVNKQGIVKITDLGLVKTPETLEEEELLDNHDSQNNSDPNSLTRLGQGVGTPSFIAPEQARNAATVDARADIYSLGCTFYMLLVGRPPFQGSSGMDIMLKHVRETPTFPQEQVNAIPEEIKTLILKMLAKNPNERPDDLGQIIELLEGWQKRHLTPKLTPRPEDIDALTKQAQTFQEAQVSKIRYWSLLGYTLGGPWFILLMFLFGWTRFAMAFLMIWSFTPLCVMLMESALVGSQTLRSFRGMMAENAMSDWLTWGITAFIALVFLILFKLLALIVVCLMLSTILAVLWFVYIARPMMTHQDQVIEEVRKLLMQMQQRGWQEQELRLFIAQYAGQKWEPIFEKLFGYEQLQEMRKAKISDASGQPLAVHHTFRDMIISWIDQRKQARIKKREEKLAALAKAQEPPQAVPVPQAVPMAIPVATPPQAEEATSRQSAIQLRDREAERAAERSRWDHVDLFDLLFGPRVRFFLGVALIGVFLYWVYQNVELPEGQFNLAWTKEIPWNNMNPLTVEGVPNGLLILGSSINVGVAGLLLILSAFSPSRKIALFFLIAAVVMIFAQHWGFPGLYGFTAERTSLIAGGAVALFGFFFNSMTWRED